MHQKTDFTASTDWNRLNLRSVTDQNSLDEFLTTAQLAGTDFAAGYCRPSMMRHEISIEILFRTFECYLCPSRGESGNSNR